MERLVYERSLALGYAIELSTSSAYNSHLNSYLNFCRLHERSVDPTADTLSFFVVWLAHHIEPRSIESYLSGIASRLEPFFPAVRDTRRSLLVSRTLQGCKRHLSKPITRAPALGVSDINRVVAALVGSRDYDTVLFLALLVTGFTTLQRLGELVWSDSLRLQSWRKVALRHTVTISDEGMSYLLPSPKSDRSGSGSRVLVPASAILPLDAFPRLRAYLSMRDMSFAHHPALWVTANGEVPTRAWFLRRLRQSFHAGISGHSLRAGGATALASAGLAPELIQAAGRWSSASFERYIRQHPFILHAIIHAQH